MPREKALCGKEEIIRTAVEIVDAEGMDALSARRVAKDLGVSAMTIYNYVDNLRDIQKQVLISGFDRMYGAIYQALNAQQAPVDKITFCRTIAKQVFQFAGENRHMFLYMESDGRRQFGEDAEVRPFYNLISKLAKRAKATRSDYAEDVKCYTLLDMMVSSIAYQYASRSIDLTETEYDELIDFFLARCLTEKAGSN